MTALRRLRAATALILLAIAGPAAASDLELSTYTLPNGLTVILHPDHTLPQVVLNTWFGVGSKDEPQGRSGFAHLFEHLMFMGTERVPGNRYDLTMEQGGGSNNASTSTDRTNYFSFGPSSLLPTLLWLDADRLDGLGRAMTQEKLDLQREVVRNELRQSIEDTPYGAVYVMVPQALYPEGHPYHHSTIGNHVDLEAATLEDVQQFFETYYVPGNASLVVAGDFDPALARKLIAQTFGAIPAKPLPLHRTAPPVVLEREVRRMAVDQVESPRLVLVWPSPPAYSDGDAELDLIADILAGGPSSRLYRRLVIDELLARDVAAINRSKELGSELWLQVTAVIDGDLERIKRVVCQEIERLKADGPTVAELDRVKAASEASFLRHREELLERADLLNEYRHFLGDPDGFDRDLARYSSTTVEEVTRWARAVLGAGRVDLRILPADGSVAGADLDRRPDDLPAPAYRPPHPSTLTLSNGIPVHLVPRPGSGLLSGALVVDGGERLSPEGLAGLASLAATMLTSGAGGRSAAEFAEAVDSLGASIEPAASWHDISISFSGLTSKLDPTLDLLADAVLRPNLSADDFTRERALALDELAARADHPARLGFDVGRALLYGASDPRGQPPGGFPDTVGRSTREALAAALPGLLDPSRARFVVVGDVEPERLRSALEARFGARQGGRGPAVPRLQPVSEPAPGQIVLVDRLDAPQTFLLVARPVTQPVDEDERAARSCLNTLFGGTFASRINVNLRERHGYTYLASSVIQQDAEQHQLMAYASVERDVTGAALAELRREFDRLATGDVTTEELGKAISTLRHKLTVSAETTESLAATLEQLVSDGRPLDSVATSLERLGRVDLDRVNALARSGLYDWGSLLVVLVGDATHVLPQLEAAGFARPQLIDERGAPVDAR